MEVIQRVLNLINQFSHGDLVAGMEILEGLKEILNGDEVHPDDLDTLRDVLEIYSTRLKEADPAIADSMGIIFQILSKYSSVTNDQDNGSDQASSMIFIEDSEVLFSFFVEAHDHLDTIEEKILKLEDSRDIDLVNVIFRAIHTVKGVSSFLGLHNVDRLSHSLETVFDDIRTNKITVTEMVIDHLLAGTDLLSRLIQFYEAEADIFQTQVSFELPASDIDCELIISVLNKLHDQQDSEHTQSDTPVTPSSSNQHVPREEMFSEELITPEMLHKFDSETTDLLDGVEKDILYAEKQEDHSEYIENSFRAIHTIKGNAGFFWFSSIERECMNIESLLDLVRSKKKVLDHQFVSILLERIDIIRTQLTQIQQGILKPGQDIEEEKPLGELLVDMGIATQESVDKALSLQQMKLGEILVEEGQISRDSLKTALGKQGCQIDSGASADRTFAAKRKDIRVDTDKLDQLFDLMGELITAEEMLIHNPEITNLNLEGFEKATNYLTKITREMQELTMTIRMIPLEGLFNKMKRLVRDLSRKFDKNVNLKISGEDTEMDKNVIDEIADPLVHIIRNAIDHGLEDSDERLKAGKTVEGKISLSAHYEGNEIWITVADDGKGLNRDRILQKAVERGVVSENSELSDDDIWHLIFEPGFSTADKVSEISGRGVGMDVVKKNIEKLRGKVDVFSTPGEESKFVLRIPLTLAIIEGVSTRVGDNIFSFPTAEITNFHKAEPGQITSIDNSRQLLKLREELYPIIKLHEFYDVGAKFSKPDEGIMVITGNGKKRGAILVDEILGYNQLVIKALPEYLGELRAVSGCSIMGNGELGLILDISMLLETAIS